MGPLTCKSRPAVDGTSWAFLTGRTWGRRDAFADCEGGLTTPSRGIVSCACHQTPRYYLRNHLPNLTTSEAVALVCSCGDWVWLLNFRSSISLSESGAFEDIDLDSSCVEYNTYSYQLHSGPRGSRQSSVSTIESNPTTRTSEHLEKPPSPCLS